MIDHDGDVLVVAAIAQLVDTDVRQVVERVGGAMARHDAFDDRTHGPPRDPHQRAERRLVRFLRQIRHLLLEVVGEPGLALSPRNELDDHTATGTVDAADGVAKPDAKRPYVQVAPIALASVVNRMVTVHAPGRGIAVVGPFPTLWDQSSLAV